jgi:choline dehydrogenase
VVLCGGAVNSPQLLMLSGVGPARHLEAVGVRCVVDRPGVGQNLQDHPLTGVNCASRRGGTLDSAGTLWDLARFLLFRRGRLTSNVGEAGGFVRTDARLPAPDVQLYFAPGFFVEHGFIKPGGPGYSVGACLLRPRSRGEVALASADPLARPLIRPRYFTEASDVRVLLEGLKLARRISRAAAFDAVRGAEYRPGEEVRSDEELARAMLRQFETVYHPVGTCAMGTGPPAVVDAGLRVHGVAGLRVVDASVMPTLVGGNTNAPVIMIAEKAADLILGRAPPREEAV